MRGVSSEKTIESKEAYKRLAATQGARVCSYRVENGIFVEPLFKEAVKTCVQQIIYCGVGSCHQNSVV